MSQEEDTTQQPAPDDVPHEDELDVEGPNESAPGHNPPYTDSEDDAGSTA